MLCRSRQKQTADDQAARTGPTQVAMPTCMHATCATTRLHACYVAVWRSQLYQKLSPPTYTIHIGFTFVCLPCTELDAWILQLLGSKWRHALHTHARNDRRPQQMAGFGRYARHSRHLWHARVSPVSVESAERLIELVRLHPLNAIAIVASAASYDLGGNPDMRMPISLSRARPPTY